MRFARVTKYALAFSLLSAATAVSGCQTTKTEVAKAGPEMAPAEAETYLAGSRWTWREQGKEDVTVEAMSVDEGKVSLQATNGCSYELVPDGFGLFTSWNNCYGSTGSMAFERSGSIFPLEVGKTERIKVRGHSKGNVFSTTMFCRVAETANVTVPAGTFDTYRVVCTDDHLRQDWYFAPELGTSVISARSPVGSSQTTPYHLELVKYEREE